MTGFLEPSMPPRGPEPFSIEANRLLQSLARLQTYRVPRYNNAQLRYRQAVVQGKKREPLQPQQSPVQEGLLALAQDTENNKEGSNARTS